MTKSENYEHDNSKESVRNYGLNEGYPAMELLLIIAALYIFFKVFGQRPPVKQKKGTGIGKATVSITRSLTKIMRLK